MHGDNNKVLAFIDGFDCYPDFDLERIWLSLVENRLYR